MSQFFFNQRASLVNDVIEGTIIASPWNNLARLESDPAIRVVVRRDLNKNNVAVISGGGAGHEPAHVGFWCPSMLTGRRSRLQEPLCLNSFFNQRRRPRRR